MGWGMGVVGDIGGVGWVEKNSWHFKVAAFFLEGPHA